ncbi:MAG: DNA translocase FtsK 4TM domain-containing protein, partial [Bacillota bacterium]|nr:DNA translocase FtsK 4TM domain-containing protein [Bacillota bacterium]
MAKRRTKAKTTGRSLGVELWGLLFIGLGGLAYLARLTTAAGNAGARVVEYLYKAFGYGAMLFPLFPLALGSFFVLRGRWPRADRRLAGLTLAYVLGLLCLHWIWVPDGRELSCGQAGMGGGLVGGWLAVLFLRWFGHSGRFAIGGLLALMALLLATGLSFGRALGLGVAGVRWAAVALTAQGREFVAGLRMRLRESSRARGIAFRETENGRLVRKEPETPAAPRAAATAAPVEAAGNAVQAAASPAPA